MDVPLKWRPFGTSELRLLKAALEAAAPEVQSILPLNAARRVRLIREIDAVLTLREIQQEGESELAGE